MNVASSVPGACECYERVRARVLMPGRSTPGAWIGKTCGEMHVGGCPVPKLGSRQASDVVRIYERSGMVAVTGFEPVTKGL
jgi:hypothetical protein